MLFHFLILYFRFKTVIYLTKVFMGKLYCVNKLLNVPKLYVSVQLCQDLFSLATAGYLKCTLLDALFICKIFAFLLQCLFVVSSVLIQPGACWGVMLS